MLKIIKTLKDHIFFFLSVFVLLSLYIQTFYFNLPIYYDSGVFAYVGSAINLGKLPYIDAWDHKGLWIYFFNAFSLKLFGGNFFGIYLIEFSLLLCVLAYIYKSEIILSNKNKVTVSIILFILSYALFFEGGNLPETIFLPWQLLFYYFTYKYLSRGNVNLNIVLFFGAIAFTLGTFIRPNNIFGVCFLLFILFLTNNNKLIFSIKLILALLLSFIPFFLYIYNNNILQALIENYINYNIHYSSMTLGNRFFNLILFSSMVILSPLFLSLIYNIVRNYKFIVFSKILLIFSLVALVDFFSQIISGRVGIGYLHYIINILSSFFIINLALDGKLIKDKLIYILISICIIFSLIFNFRSYYVFYSDVKSAYSLISNIKKYSSQSDTIYVSWADSWIYVASQRLCFTKYFYPVPLLHKSYITGENRLNVLINDYYKNKPTLLIDWKNNLFDHRYSVSEFNDILIKDYYLISSENNFKIYKKYD